MKDLTKKVTSIFLSSVIAASGIIYAVVKKPMEGMATYMKDVTQSIDDDDIIVDNYSESDMLLYNSQDDSKVVDVPDFAREQIETMLHIKGRDITVGDLRSIQYLILVSDDEKIDMSWLNYCSNLKSLTINGKIVNSLDSVLELEGIEEMILSTGSGVPLNLHSCGFLKHCPNIQELSINGDFYSEQLSLFDNIKCIRINMLTATNIDFSALRFLDKIILEDGGYDDAITLTNDDIEMLRKEGVEIEIVDDNVSINDIYSINDELDKIISSLNLDKNATDEEKINAVLIYCLENLEYDKETTQLIEHNQTDGVNYEEFYSKGKLYGALNNDSQICGNYAALMQALLYRLGVNSYLMTSDTHGWNLIEVDGEYYYYDATWLDAKGIIINKKTEDENGITIEWDEMSSENVIGSNKQELIDQLQWYKLKPADYEANPSEYDDGIESHDANNYPIIINKVENNASSEEKFEIIIDNKKFIVPAAVIIAIMTSLGLAVAIHKKKEQDRFRKNRQQHTQNTYQFGSYNNNNYSRKNR